jgi:hypothetical protein
LLSAEGKKARESPLSPPEETDVTNKDFPAKIQINARPYLVNKDVDDLILITGFRETICAFGSEVPTNNVENCPRL